MLRVCVCAGLLVGVCYVCWVSGAVCVRVCAVASLCVVVGDCVLVVRWCIRALWMLVCGLCV